MKIGIFGGSFNPPHIMHKKVALELIEKKYVDRVIFVPTGNKYEKNDLVLDFHRYKMLELICENNLSVSDYEMREGLKYTYQTLDYFQGLYPYDEIYFILGYDNLAYFDQWKNYAYILQNYFLLVVARGENQTFEQFSAYKEHLIFTTIEKMAVSSSEIRKQLKERRFSDKIDVKVLNYILKHDLYC